jgi:16S rRNA (adenine1518-N6/adenine1519-N6)-dimethyltransferase
MQKKKSLGQHFLRAQHYLALVADAAHLEPEGTVLEVGPGDGALTEVLLARGAHVVAVEKDRRLIPLLQEKFAGHSFEVVEADALEVQTERIVPPGEPYTLAGNIPYYITGALFKKFLTVPHQPKRLVFLIQKEVAERIARSKKESLLSLSIKAYGSPRYIKTVPRGAFSPPPEVDSAILALEHISRDNFLNAEHEARFFELLRAGFAHKRKRLASNLAPLLGNEHANILQNVGISANARAEDVPLAAWLELARN